MRMMLATLTAGALALATTPAFAQIRIQGNINVPGLRPVQQPVYVAPPVQQPVYVAPVQQPQAVYVAPPGAAGWWGPRWQDPNVFSQRARNRMGQIEAGLRVDVQRGRVAPRALNAFSRQQMEAERRLSFAVRDGVIQPFERRSVNEVIDRMQQLDERFAMYGRPGAPYGGGPNGGRPYYNR